VMPVRRSEFFGQCHAGPVMSQGGFILAQIQVIRAAMYFRQGDLRDHPIALVLAISVRLPEPFFNELQRLTEVVTTPEKIAGFPQRVSQTAVRHAKSSQRLSLPAGSCPRLRAFEGLTIMRRRSLGRSLLGFDVTKTEIRIRLRGR